MKNKLILVLAAVFLLLNSCKKVSQSFVKIKVSGKAFDVYTKKPLAGIKVYNTRMDKKQYDEIIAWGEPLYSFLFKPIDSTYTDVNGNYKYSFKKDPKFEYSIGVGNFDSIAYNTLFYNKTKNFTETNFINDMLFYPYLPCKYIIENPNRYFIYSVYFLNEHVHINSSVERFIHINRKLAAYGGPYMQLDTKTCPIYDILITDPFRKIEYVNCERLILNDTINIKVRI